MSDSEAELQLAGVAADLIETISLARAAEIAASGALPGKRELTPRQRDAARAAGEHAAGGIKPDRAGSSRHCDVCGSTRAELVAGIDGPDGPMVCRDERQCEARRNHRFMRPDLVPEGVMDVLGKADDAQARQQAAQQSQQQQAVTAQAVARQLDVPPGWTSAPGAGSVDEFGTWHPPQPPVHPLVPLAMPRVDPRVAHTLMNPHNRSHLLSGQRPHYYPGGRELLAEGADSAQQLPGGQVPGPAPGAAQQAAPQPPGGAAGQAQPQWQQPPSGMGGPPPRRRKARKPAAGHPGIDGSDSFGNGPDTGGPGAGSASAET